MPTYEYRCPNGHEFEKFFRSISAAAGEHPCPTCSAVGLRQLSGGAGLMFKGSGFYLTDYGKNAHAKKGPAPTGSGDGAAGGEAAASAGERTARDGAGAKPSADSAPKAEAASSSTGTGGDSGKASPPATKPKSTE